MNWTVLADLLIRSTILIIGAEGMRKLFKRSSAAQRHRLLLLVLLFLAALPVFSGLLPPIRIPVWHSSSVQGTVTVQSFFVGIRETRRVQESSLNWPFLLWLCGVAGALAPLISGRLMIRRIIRRARLVRDSDWMALAKELTRTVGLRQPPAILAIDAPVMPMALGWLRPRILLPASSSGWSESRKRAVLLHELVHIRRGDISTGLLSNCIAALWWFQPLVWMSRRELRRESEKACDADVVATGIRPSDYAAELISVAREFKSGRLRPIAGIAMACPRDLEGRVLEILDSPSNPSARSAGLAAVVLLTAIAISASAITLSSNSRFRFKGEPSPMRKTLFSGLLASAGLSAATLTGSVSEATGLPIPHAGVSLYNPDNSSKQESTSTADGKFTFDNLAAGQYILRIEKPGFTPIFREFTLDANSNVERSLVLLAGSNQPKAPEQELGADAAGKPQLIGPGRLRVGGQVMESKIINKVQPVYPAAAKAARVQGTVLLEAVISKDGTPGEITVLQSPSEDLSQASLEAVRQWRYSTMLLNGQPIEVVTDIVINFTLTE